MYLKLADNLAKIVLRCFFISIFFIISTYTNATEKKNDWDIKANKVSGQTFFFMHGVAPRILTHISNGLQMKLKKDIT